MNKTQSLNNLAILEDLGEVKSTPSINNAINVSDHNSDGYLVGFDFEDEDGSSTKIVSLNDIPKPPPNPKPPPKPLVESSTPPQIFQPSSPFKPLKRSTSFSSLKSSKLSRSSSFNSLAMLSKSAPISRSVSFAKINIREHSQVLGDHPSCSRGPPVSLGWEVEREWEGDLDAWEGQREGERRDRRAMHMDASEREELVLENGANVSDITRTTENIKRVKISRAESAVMGGKAISISAAMESIGRKMKRNLTVSGKKARIEDKKILKQGELSAEVDERRRKKEEEEWEEKEF